MSARLAIGPAGAALLALACAGAAAAQDIAAGARAGLGVSTFAGADAVDPDARIGIVAGAFLSYPLTRRLALQPELLYVQKGARGTESVGALALHLSYVELPVLLKYLPGGGGAVRPSLFAGPAVAFRRGCTVEDVTTGDSFACDDPQFSGEVGVKRVDLGLVIGAGAAFALRSGALIVDGRYEVGLRNLDDVYDADYRNRAFSLTAGFAVPVGSR